MTYLSFDELVKDFLRGLMVRYVNPIWPFWDLEGTYPEYAEFQLADNILHLIYNQGVLWMACYFSPVFPLIHLLKIICLFYLRAWSGLRIVHSKIVLWRGSSIQEDRLFRKIVRSGRSSLS